MPFELPPLPYAMDALEPHMSKQTLEFHYGAPLGGEEQQQQNVVDLEECRPEQRTQLRCSHMGHVIRAIGSRRCTSSLAGLGDSPPQHHQIHG